MSSTPRGVRGRTIAPVLLAAVAALVLTLILPRGAGAADRLFWDNYTESSEPSSVGVANLDGSGGTALNLGAIVLVESEGIAYDSATGRLFVAGSEGGFSGEGLIAAVDVEGGSATQFAPSGAQIAGPVGVAVDPVRRKLFWVNGATNSIGWADLDGGGAGLLNTSGVAVSQPYRIAVDPVGGRVYWGNYDGDAESGQIAYANADNSGGGGVMPIGGVDLSEGIRGIAVDPTTARIYWTMGGDRFYYAPLAGGAATEISTSLSSVNNGYGVAVDPTISRVYWGNYGNDLTRDGAIGFADLAGGGGGISLPTGPVDGPQDPVIVKAPIAASAPVVSRPGSPHSPLVCSRGQWGEDFAGSFVYRAPRSYAYQWTLNGAPVSGATGAVLAAPTPGAYACTVTATNPAGTASQTSAALGLTAGSYALSLKKKVAKVKPGKAAKLRLTLANGGDFATPAAKLCVTVPKRARKSLKAPKCKKLGALAAGAKRTVTIAVKAKKQAKGKHKVTLKLKGVSAKPVKATIKVKKTAGKHKKRSAKR